MDSAVSGGLLRLSLSHDAGFYVLIDTLVVMVMMKLVIIRSSAAGMKGRDSVEVEDKVLPVTHRC